VPILYFFGKPRLCSAWRADPGFRCGSGGSGGGGSVVPWWMGLSGCPGRLRHSPALRVARSPGVLPSMDWESWSPDDLFSRPVKVKVLVDGKEVLCSRFGAYREDLALITATPGSFYIGSIAGSIYAPRQQTQTPRLLQQASVFRVQPFGLAQPPVGLRILAFVLVPASTPALF
jgi:hypothetical protein